MFVVVVFFPFGFLTRVSATSCKKYTFFNIVSLFVRADLQNIDKIISMVIFLRCQHFKMRTCNLQCLMYFSDNAFS